MGEVQSRQPAATPAAQTLEAELDRIAALGLDEVRALWREMTQQNAPKALARDLLARVIAYRVQEQRLGKLSREMRKLLDRLARGGAEPPRHLKVGTVMVREHQGTLHEVMVVPGGFSWQEKTYPSLSTIAQAITGTSWNGPRFFGLRGGSGPEAAVEPVPVVGRAVRGNLSIVESHLIWGGSVFSDTWINWRRLLDGLNTSTLEEALADEIGEPEDRDSEAVRSGGCSAMRARWIGWSSGSRTDSS